MTAYVPEPGDIVWLDFTPQAGHEQAGRRSGLVVSRASFNDKTGFAWICAITNAIKGYPFEVQLPPSGQTSGVVLSDQCRSLDWLARNATFREKVPSATLALVLRNLHSILA